MKKFAIAIVGVVLVSSFFDRSAQAELIWGLTTAQSLVSFDSAAPGTTSTPVSITGVSTGSIVDIDFSPVNASLYGMASNGDLYKINTATGVATLVLGVGSQIPANTITSPTDIDFNPAADRIRVFQSANDGNFRLTGDASSFNNPGLTAGTATSDGTIAYTGGTPDPFLVGMAYTNNFDGTGSTSLYSIDTNNDSLVLHSGGPQFNTITVVGTGLGFAVGTLVGFDISALQGSVAGYVSDSNSFYTVNLSTGQLTLVGTIGGAKMFQSIAAQTVPEPSTIALFTVGLIGAGIWRLRRGRSA